MRSAQSTQQKESELKNSRSCHICLKKQAARVDSPPLNQILKRSSHQLEEEPINLEDHTVDQTAQKD
ncbi:hypothetical protein ACFX2I_040623 [Malus domestica]